MYENDFALRLSELRLKKGVSARDMSLSLGQNSGYINHIENCQTLPSMTVFFNICEYLSITPQQFFELDNPNPVLINEMLNNLKLLNTEELDSIGILLNSLAN